MHSLGSKPTHTYTFNCMHIKCIPASSTLILQIYKCLLFVLEMFQRNIITNNAITQTPNQLNQWTRSKAKRCWISECEKYNIQTQPQVYCVMLIFSNAHCKFCGIFDMHEEYDDWLDAKLLKIVDWLDFAFTLKF